MRKSCTDPDAIPGLCLTDTFRRLAEAPLSRAELEAVDIINRGIVYDDDKYKKILDLTMKPGMESFIEDLDFKWKCMDFKPSYMDF
jgi:hypothetical protein